MTDDPSTPEYWKRRLDLCERELEALQAKLSQPVGWVAREQLERFLKSARLYGHHIETVGLFSTEDQRWDLVAIYTLPDEPKAPAGPPER